MRGGADDAGGQVRISASTFIQRDGEVYDLVVYGLSHTPGVRGDVELTSVHLDARGEPEWTGEPLSDAEYRRAIEAMWDASLQEPAVRRELLADRIDRAHDEWKERRLERDLGR